VHAREKSGVDGSLAELGKRADASDENAHAFESSNERACIAHDRVSYVRRSGFLRKRA
jgi:hypothetical protein